MIKSIVPGTHVEVVGGYSSNPFINTGAPSAGLVRYNGNSSLLEVYDGTNWTTLHQSVAQIDLTPDVKNLLEWARQKRDEEQRLMELAKTNETLKDAVDELTRAQEKVKIVSALVQQ